MIQLESASKVYQTGDREVRALDDVSLEINQGEFVAIRGPSGCGKSTLLALLGGLTQATSGKVKVLGKDLAQMSLAERARFRAENIGFVFQMFHLLPYLNVLDNVLVAAPQAGKQQDREYAEELLHRFGLQDRINHRPSQLSAGERQRVAMARALLNRPKLLLADEPTGNLDPQNASAVLDLLADYHQDSGHQDSGHQDSGHQDSGHQDSGHQDSGHQDSGHQDSGHQDSGHQDSGHQGSGHQGSGHQEGGTVLMVTHEEYAAKYAQTTIALANGRLQDNVSVGQSLS